MSRLLCTIEDVNVFQEEDSGRVHYIAKAAVDADGANGQNGHQAAYRDDNKGSEDLANGGMKIVSGVPIFSADWGKDIVLTSGGFPLVFPNGVIPSRTAYRFKDKSSDDPEAYVDAETIPYCVVSPLIRNAAKGVVLGCRCVMTNTENGKSVEGVVADIGPKKKIGELSIAAGRALGLNPSPRNGGTEDKIIHYQFWPGMPATVGGVKFDLIPA